MRKLQTVWFVAALLKGSCGRGRTITVELFCDFFSMFVQSRVCPVISLMLSTSNEHEERILEVAFQQLQVNVIVFKPSYQQYVKMLQYLPDVILLEFPTRYSDQLHFIKLIKTHKKLQKIPVIGYGAQLDSQIQNGILQHGASSYHVRPLKFSALLVEIERFLKKNHKSFHMSEQKSSRHKDVDLLLDPNELPMKKIEIMRRYIAGILAFPFTVTKVLRVSEDENSGAKELSRVIEADPAISAHILKVSNTVFFASSNRRINSIKDAIVRIGFRETKRITLAMSVMELFDKNERTPGFDRIDFWYHSLSTAIVAEHIAKKMRGVNPEEAFLAGLLHDFGIILFETYFSEIFSKVLEKTTNEGSQFVAVENQILKVNHCDVMKDLFESWKIPTDLTEAVCGHYLFRQLLSGSDSIGQKLTICTGLANVITKALFLGRSCDQFVEPVADELFAVVKMPDGVSTTFIKVIYNEVDTYRKFLNLDEREFPFEHSGIDNAQNYSLCLIDLKKTTFIPAEVYLRKEGFEIVVIREPVDPDTLHNKHDLIIILTGSQPFEIDINSFSSIENRLNSRNQLLAPLLVMCHDEQAFPVDLPENTSVIPQSIDLRRLDQAIADCLSGKPVFIDHSSNAVLQQTIPDTNNTSEA